MTHFIWISAGYVTTLFDELKHVLSGWSETTARKSHAATAQNQGRSHCVLQQLHTTRDRQDEKSVCCFNLITAARSGDLCKNWYCIPLDLEITYTG